MEKFKKICINCPAGCHLEIEKEGDAITVRGNSCPRGIAYARQEVTDPRRVVTAVVAADAPERLFIPVKTTAPVPMAEIPELLKKLFSMRVALPVHPGDVLLKDHPSAEITVVATGTGK